MTKRSIDINCDVGEGVGNEKDLFPMISSCNIACGGHAGSKETIKLCLELAKKYQVKVGAHPSYPDVENFGRVSMSISNDVLIKSIQTQMQAFESVRKEIDIPLHHIKPHGALYNDIAKDVQLAETFLTAIAPCKHPVLLYVPYNSVIQKLAIKNGFEVLVEAFADRNYNDDLSLVSRKEKDALITSGKEVLNHILHMYNDKLVKTITGKNVTIEADTYCIHGDTPAALQILTYLSNELPYHNLQVKP
ncbi:5-oxoprolinase subunit PxpA [Maribacter sp. M208]|uniref:5-oxoprolinase subunit PxpA n=1 Tax=Maribacter huludaoensis TaxID=3030010 RepID=UPI0023ED712D|nr:5-oxoprolinase subunit PxpA [Maribacter huludaoensis]MDF4223060.1 5-oxoprolinase subunit PxpA [Maribacter huludaoensis]